MYFYASRRNEGDGIVMSRAHWRTSNQRGQAAVEFALVTVFLVLLLVGILEMTMFVYTYSALSDAAKEGVRYAIVHGSSATSAAGPGAQANCVNSGAVVASVQSFAALSLHSASNMSINVCYPDGNNSPGSGVQVNLSYPYQPLFGLGWPTVTVYATSAGRIMF